MEISENTQEYPEIPESKKDTRKYPIVYFNTPTRPEPDPLPGIFFQYPTRPDPILKNPTRWALHLREKNGWRYKIKDLRYKVHSVQFTWGRRMPEVAVGAGCCRQLLRLLELEVGGEYDMDNVDNLDKSTWIMWIIWTFQCG